MISNNSKKKYSCPSSALFHPSVFRSIYLPISLFGCWAAVFFKARALERWPWLALFITTCFILGIFTVEILFSSYFAEYLAPAIYGFLVGVGINAIIQGLLNKLQGINWTFQSPIQFSLGALLLGFLGAFVFVSNSERVNKFLTSSATLKEKSGSKADLCVFAIILWVLTVLVALGLCINLVITLRFFSGVESPNPLQKPLWFSAGAVIFVFMIAVLSRKNPLRLLRILLPGIIVGLIWASIFRDLFMGLYLAYPKFPLAPEVLEVLLVMNFCFLGVAWLNKAEYSCYYS